MSSTPKIIFYGTPGFVVPALAALIQRGFLVVAVVTGQDKVNRKKIATPTPVKAFALEHNIPVFQPSTLKDQQFLDTLTGLKPDIAVVAGYGKIIPQNCLDAPKYGSLNIHPSLLPKYRGPTPVQTVMLNGDKKTGVTIIRLDAQVDHGPVLAAAEYDIPNAAYYEEVSRELFTLGGKLLVESILGYISDELTQREQDHSQATFTKMLERADGKINWSKTPQQIYNQIRALNPEPGAWTVWKDKTLNILHAHLEAPPLAGQASSLVLDTVQLEGSRPMPLADFINGHPDFDMSQLFG